MLRRLEVAEPVGEFCEGCWVGASTTIWRRTIVCIDEAEQSVVPSCLPFSKSSPAVASVFVTWARHTTSRRRAPPNA